MMRSRVEEVRLTISIPKEQHIKLKIKAASMGVSMRSLIIDLLKDDEECPFSHEPNKKTLKAIKDAIQGKNLVSAQKGRDYLKKLIEE